MDMAMAMDMDIDEEGGQTGGRERGQQTGDMALGALQVVLDGARLTERRPSTVINYRPGGHCLHG